MQGDPTVDKGNESPRLWVEVLVDMPQGVQRSTADSNTGVIAPDCFTYEIPPHLSLQSGDIVTVPFGSQTLGAIVLRLVCTLPPDLSLTQIRPVQDRVCSGFFPGDYWLMLERLADYYYTPLVTVVRAALPPGVLARSQRRIRLAAVDLPNDLNLFLRPAALGVLQTLQQSKTGDYTWRYLQQRVKGASTGLRDLLKRGWVESYLEQPTPPQPKLQAWVTIAGEVLLETLTEKQQQVIGILQQYDGTLPLKDLCEKAQVTIAVVHALAKKEVVILHQEQQCRLASRPLLEPDRPKTLTPHQKKALGAIENAYSSCQTILLHGVTGSGKTEVYLQAIAPCLADGRSVLVLVPEIGLTPQLTDRFQQRFGTQVLVYHSQLSDGERYDTWRQMLVATPQVVIGTRSAVFAPLPNLGLIILDEEHDSSFKQDHPMPCYHARLVAQWRSQLAGCVLILGSATPAVETWVQTSASRILGDSDSPPSPDPLYLSLPRRVYDRPQPSVQVIDMREELKRGNRSLFSHTLKQAIETMKAKGQQGLLFVPRRGHSTFVSCRSCGEPLGCPHCDVSLTYHHPLEDDREVSSRPRAIDLHPEANLLQGSLLRCHYCNFSQIQPKACPQCQSPYLKFFGSGTQRVTQEMAQLFPHLTWIRFDSDTTRRKDAHRTLLTRFAQGEADLLVGTQMLTKGIDLPQVTLVGVLAADGLLHLPDFRSGERACQMLLQVAGRSGRGVDPGQVILQTYSPDHAVIEAVKTDRYGHFLEQQLQERSPLSYPPFSQLLLLRFSSLDPALVQTAATHIAEFLQDYVQDYLKGTSRFDPADPPSGLREMEEMQHPDIELLGPAPAPILRIAQRYRWQILLKVKPFAQESFRLPLAEIKTKIHQYRPTKVSLTIDVDPLQLM